MKKDDISQIFACMHYVLPRYLENIELTAYLCSFFLFAGTSPPLTVDNTKDLMSIHINQVILASYSKYIQLHPDS